MISPGLRGFEDTGVREKKREAGTKLNDFRTRTFPQSDPSQQSNRGPGASPTPVPQGL